MAETKTKKWKSNPLVGRPAKSHFGAMTSAERQRQYRQRLKEQGRQPKVGKAVDNGCSGPATDVATGGSGKDVLIQMASRSAGELVPQIMARTKEVHSILEEASQVLAAGKSPNKGKLQADIRETCKWLTDALEQTTQRRAESDTKLVHVTFVDRRPYEDKAWAEAAAFLREVSTSMGWEQIKSADLPGLVGRGIRVLGRIV